MLIKTRMHLKVKCTCTEIYFWKLQKLFQIKQTNVAVEIGPVFNVANYGIHGHFNLIEKERKKREREKKKKKKKRCT